MSEDDDVVQRLRDIVNAPKQTGKSADDIIRTAAEAASAIEALRARCDRQDVRVARLDGALAEIIDKWDSEDLDDDDLLDIAHRARGNKL